MMVDTNVNAYEGQELAYTGEAITSTTKKTNWGVNVWRQWAAKNGETRPLETVSFEQLNKLLCRFYAEICKVSGEPYEAECLRLMRKSIERYLQENTIGEVSLKRDPTFRESNLVLKQRMRALMLRGNRKQQLVQINISAKEEDLLWRSGQLGNQSALALLNVNLLNLVKRMGIKGRKDLYMLRVEDFEVREEQGVVRVICTKPSAGGTENLRSMIANANEGEKCPVFLFREFLRHRPKHMRGIGPLFLALSNFTTDADVWYRPVRLSEATLGSIIRQMANAARTMGLSGMQNLNNGDGKINVQHGGNNQMKMETENSPANNQNNQVMGTFSTVPTNTFDENDYLSSADASILAQYYGDKGYPPTMVRSNMVDPKIQQDMKLTHDNILQSLATSLSSTLSQAAAPDFNLAAVATSLANFQGNPSLIQGAQIMMIPEPAPLPPLATGPSQHPATPPLSHPLSQSSSLSQSHIPNVVITSNMHHQPIPVCTKSPVQCRTPDMSKKSPVESTPSPNSEVIKDCTINITSKTADSIKQERMEYSEFVNKDSSTLLPDSKIIHTEIKDIMCVLKQGSARFVNCTFNFNFPN
ncbi:uncharacterized protein LOC134815133 isoform X2 [Bolinopsis microptera]|uniref:uncharacterized protein LOC134815133 isoform X2 n=1 Tax=Bolinopsis microptera TaxID=2820187 RepID=UPI00307916DD